MDVTPRRVAIALLLIGAVFLVAITMDEVRNRSTPDRATVTILDENGTRLGTVSVRVAATFKERYTGLSETESLGPNEGMLFIHEREGNHTYVMRDMSFPIDIVFISTDRRISAIHHAPVEERPLTPYRGRGRWVLEIPLDWTISHGISVGDRVRVDWSRS